MTLAAPPVPFVPADLDYAALSPMLVVFGAAIAGVLIEAFAPRGRRFAVQVVLTIVGLLAALACLVAFAIPNQGKTAGLLQTNGTTLGSVTVDGPSLFLQATVLVFAVVGVLTFAERLGGRGSDAFTPMGAATPGSALEGAAARQGLATSEVFPLFLFSVGGMMLFPSAADLITMFVALEVLSLPLYLLVGLGRRQRLWSQEAALKYFLLGAFASAFFLFGVALLYGYTGSLYLVDVARAITQPDGRLTGLLVPGVLLVVVGLLFKVGAVPFHSWTPDVYQGAPTPVTGFMAAGTKLAAFGAMLRFLYTGVYPQVWDWRPALVAVALLTMVVGAVLSVTQVHVKRLLAYSSIAHAGFVLVGVLAMDRTGVSGVLFYLAAYGLTTLAAFAIVGVVRTRREGYEAGHLSQWAGLGRRHPVTAAVFSLLLLAFAGIPLTSGFTAKFAVFEPAIRTGGASGTLMVVVGLLCSAITVFVYVRVIVMMYFTEATTDDVGVVDASALTTTTIAVGAAMTVALGVMPSAVLRLAEQAAQFIP